MVFKRGEDGETAQRHHLRVALEHFLGDRSKGFVDIRFDLKIVPEVLAAYLSWIAAPRQPRTRVGSVPIRL